MADKYTNDANAWFQNAQNTARAAKTLFDMGDIFLWFPAAILGHHALELFLKTALIRQGCQIDAAKGVWGHDLVKLGAELSAKTGVVFPDHILETFKTFNDYFDELRYPKELKKVMGLGDTEGWLLQDALQFLLAFAQPPKP